MNREVFDWTKLALTCLKLVNKSKGLKDKMVHINAAIACVDSALTIIEREREVRLTFMFTQELLYAGYLKNTEGKILGLELKYPNDILRFYSNSPIFVEHGQRT